MNQLIDDQEDEVAKQMKQMHALKTQIMALEEQNAHYIDKSGELEQDVSALKRVLMDGAGGADAE